MCGDEGAAHLAGRLVDVPRESLPRMLFGQEHGLAAMLLDAVTIPRLANRIRGALAARANGTVHEAVDGCSRPTVDARNQPSTGCD